MGAGAVSVSRLLKRTQRPEIAAADGKGCRAISHNSPPAYVLQNPLGVAHVIRKLPARLVIRSDMSRPMRGKFMPARHDASHHVGISLGNPAQRKERSLDVVVGKELQDPIDVSLYPAFDLVPVRT